MIFENLMYFIYLIAIGLLCKALGGRINKRFGLNTWLVALLVFAIFLGSGAIWAWFMDRITRVTNNIELPIMVGLWILYIAVGIYGSNINNRAYFKGFLLGLLLGPLGAILSITSKPLTQCKSCGKKFEKGAQFCPYCKIENSQSLTVR